MTLKFNNYTFVHGGKEHLASGEAVYSVVDNYDEQEAFVDDVYLIEVLSPYGWVKKEQVADFKDSVLTSLNRDENFLRSLTP